MALFLTPALTALIGHAAWWPGHGDRTEEPEHDQRTGGRRLARDLTSGHGVTVTVTGDALALSCPATPVTRTV